MTVAVSLSVEKKRLITETEFASRSTPTGRSLRRWPTPFAPVTSAGPSLVPAQAGRLGNILERHGEKPGAVGLQSMSCSRATKQMGTRT